MATNLVTGRFPDAGRRASRRSGVADARIGTPAYVYDLDAISAEARELHAAFDSAAHLVAYAVKANSAGPVVRALAVKGAAPTW